LIGFSKKFKMSLLRGSQISSIGEMTVSNKKLVLTPDFIQGVSNAVCLGR